MILLLGRSVRFGRLSLARVMVVMASAKLNRNLFMTLTESSSMLCRVFLGKFDSVHTVCSHRSNACTYVQDQDSASFVQGLVDGIAHRINDRQQFFPGVSS